MTGLRVVMAQKKMRLKPLSDATGISVAYLSILRNRDGMKPSYDTLKKIADALSVEIKELL